jgi:hypothetical protein
MSLGFNIVALAFIAFVVGFAGAVLRAHWVTKRERREDRDRLRTGDALARDFRRTVAEGHLTLPEWGPPPVYPRHPETPKERP